MGPITHALFYKAFLRKKKKNKNFQLFSGIPQYDLPNISFANSPVHSLKVGRHHQKSLPLHLTSHSIQVSMKLNCQKWRTETFPNTINERKDQITNLHNKRASWVK